MESSERNDWAWSGSDWGDEIDEEMIEGEIDETGRRQSVQVLP